MCPAVRDYYKDRKEMICEVYVILSNVFTVCWNK